MKKLMIAAAIVCAAAFAQAANFTWGNNSYSIDNWNGNQAINPDLDAPMYESGKMFLYLGTVGYEAGEGFDLASATLITAGTYDADQYAYGNFDSSAYSQSDLVNKMGGDVFTLILTEGGKTLAEMAEGDHFVLRTGVSGTNYDGILEDNAAEFYDLNPIGASDWTTYSSVPEPTSGLLLLLGVAGLALKRKRA